METITVQTTIRAPLSLVWEMWTESRHIEVWNHASPDWHTPHAENDVRVGGTFLSRMEAKDGSEGFDFTGTYTEVEPLHTIAYRMDDGRRVITRFEEGKEGVTVTETFDLETQNTVELQRSGWQSILDTFAKYVESQVV